MTLSEPLCSDRDQHLTAGVLRLDPAVGVGDRFEVKLLSMNGRRRPAAVHIASRSRSCRRDWTLTSRARIAALSGNAAMSAKTSHSVR